MSGKQTNINNTIVAWADIVINIWLEKLVQQQVYDTGDLQNSLKHFMLRNSGNDIAKVEFTFLLYGIFVDAGVGGQVNSANKNDYDDINSRKPKPWFFKKFYNQVMKLAEILSVEYAQSIAYTMVNTLTSDDVKLAPSSIREVKLNS